MTMKNMYKLGAVTMMIVCASCSCKTPLSTPEVLHAYQEYKYSEEKRIDNYNAYFDLSDGLLSAYNDPITKENLKSIVNKITGNSQCKQVYALKNSKIEKLDKSQTELYNYIMTPSSYALLAPIEETLKQIVSEDRSAVLITDFEEYSNGVIQQQNYAKKYFVDWLNKGYDISFYVMDYTEGKKNKHLYFAVFDSAGSALAQDITNALEGNQVNYKKFNLGVDNISYEYSYMSKTTGGSYHSKDGLEDLVSCTNETGEGDCYTLYEDFNSEFYPFEASWEDIVANAKAMSEPGNTPVFTHLITGPIADFTQMTGFEIQRLGLRVTNIQNDFDKFAGYYDFKKTGANVDENGKILPEYDYSKSGGNISEVADMFVYGGQVEKGKASINIDLNPMFSGQIAGVSTGDLLRIDVVITECRPHYELVDQLFAWDGNASLAQAVRNTLQDFIPNGKIIYSFFVRAN